MMVPAIDESDLNRVARQAAGATQAAEPRSHHHHVRALVVHAVLSLRFCHAPDARRCIYFARSPKF